MTVTQNRNGFSSSLVRALLRCAQFTLFFAGFLALIYVGFVLAETQIYQKDQSTILDHAPKSTLTAPPAGVAIGRVEIPRLGLTAVVIQGDSEPILKLAVGHIPGTALPGQSGNMALAGHRDTFFRALRNIRVGDQIVFESPAGSYEYQVESASVVPPTDLSVLKNSGSRELTLITCYPFSWIGSAPDRFIVRAR
jgi:sortase A